MSMFNTGDILETIEMFTQDNLDVRTVTMGISLLDCIDPDPKKPARISITRSPPRLRTLSPPWSISAPSTVFPSSTSASALPPSPCCWVPARRQTPWTLQRRWTPPVKKVGVNFVGGYSALVHKGLFCR